MLENWNSLEVQKLTLVVSTLGFVAVVIALVWNARQTKIAGLAAKDAAYTRVMGQWTRALGHLQTYPELRPYFYAGQAAVGLEDEAWNRLLSICEEMINALDSLLVFEERYQMMSSRSEWESYIIDLFGNSPIMREYISMNARWYVKGLSELNNKSITNINANKVRRIEPERP